MLSSPQDGRKPDEKKQMKFEIILPPNAAAIDGSDNNMVRPVRHTQV